jgi:hypothetical protein
LSLAKLWQRLRPDSGSCDVELPGDRVHGTHRIDAMARPDERRDQIGAAVFRGPIVLTIAWALQVPGFDPTLAIGHVCGGSLRWAESMPRAKDDLHLKMSRS